METKEERSVIIARLFTDEDIFKSLSDACRKHNVDTAIIVSAIGQIKQFSLGYFDGKEYHFNDYEKPHELLSISGMISKLTEEDEYKFHLHAVVGNEEMKASGGHLSRGIAHITNEVVLLNTGMEVKRSDDGLFLNKPV